MSAKMKDWAKGSKAYQGKGAKRFEEDKDYVKKYPDKVIFSRLLEFLKPYKRDVVSLVICLLITSITQLVYPIGMTIILQIIYPSQNNSAISQYIGIFLSFLSDDPYIQLLSVGIILFAVMIVNFFVKRTYNYNLHKLSQFIITDLRGHMFNHVQDLSLGFYNAVPAGKIISRITNDVSTVQALISTEIVQAIGDMFMIISTIVLMFAMSLELTLYIMLFAPLFAFIFIMFSKRSRKYFIEERRTIAELTGLLQESISGSKTIKAFVTEEDNIDEFFTVNKANKEITLKAARLKAILQPVMQVMIAVAIGLVIYLGSIFVQRGQLDVSLLLGYVILAQQFMNPFNNLGNLFNNAQHALAAGDRILTIIDTKPDITEPANAISLPPVKGEIIYDQVGFEYVANIPVLKDVNLRVEPNQRVALVGFTGAGKSTFISLLSRFYDPTSGKILIDGHDIKQVKLDSLRQQMGIVLQDTFLFSGTIMENIRYGKLEASDADVIEAAKKVGADPFINRLPEDYQTDVRERGGLLSVGQRQLISFARALLADPRVLILDEATSSVDPYTELKIQEALEILLRGRNSFIIAHRLSTILNSDLILVMDNGTIIQKGTHEELIRQGGLYKHLYEMQFKAPQEKEALERTDT